jgi:hypothetical protein
LPSETFLDNSPLSGGAAISLSAVPSADAPLLVFHILQVSTHNTEDTASDSKGYITSKGVQARSKDETD